MIEVENLTKRYGERTAINGLTFQANKGEVVGVSNPHPHCQIYATNFVFKTIETEARARLVAPAAAQRQLVAPVRVVSAHGLTIVTSLAVPMTRPAAGPRLAPGAPLAPGAELAFGAWPPPPVPPPVSCTSTVAPFWTSLDEALAWRWYAVLLSTGIVTVDPFVSLIVM